LPAYLNALTLERASTDCRPNDCCWPGCDWDWGPSTVSLGLTAGLLQPNSDRTRPARRAEYGADVTYGAWEQFAYDYLRDTWPGALTSTFHAGGVFAIVDEAISS